MESVQEAQIAYPRPLLLQRIVGSSYPNTSPAIPDEKWNTLFINDTFSDYKYFHYIITEVCAQEDDSESEEIKVERNSSGNCCMFKQAECEDISKEMQDILKSTTKLLCDFTVLEEEESVLLGRLGESRMKMKEVKDQYQSSFERLGSLQKKLTDALKSSE
ncbi:hypothetical protein QAD02_002236 [Eretmocerus hayati]|uniref:Uncharacterized protein n=1 Tax=Eretmocerus hayati TaxID=131215 RepID=A0ACC2NL79_9HYME|nr:hypothetical protein QAD02_002236 [Eretmocerus hayati]